MLDGNRVARGAQMDTPVLFYRRGIATTAGVLLGSSVTGGATCVRTHAVLVLVCVARRSLGLALAVVLELVTPDCAKESCK